MRAASLFILAVGLVACEAHSLERARPRHCGGGDGPSPLQKLSGIQTSIEILPIAGPLKEFAYSERTNELVYRTQRNDLFSTQLAHGGYRYLSSSFHRPLSPVFDPLGRFALVESGTDILDLRRGTWHRLPLQIEPSRYLFWSGDDVYGMVSEEDEYRKTFKVQGYRIAAATVTPVCGINTSSSASLMPVEGSVFPFVYFHHSTERAGEVTLSLTRMDVRNCALQNLGTYDITFKGPIKSVHRFDALDAFAVQVDHPELRFLWDTPARCEYVDIGAGTALFPNYSEPVVLTWRIADSNPSFIDLETRRVFPLQLYERLSSLRQNDVWLSTGRNRLVMAPDSKVGGGNRYVIEILLHQRGSSPPPQNHAGHDAQNRHRHAK